MSAALVAALAVWAAAAPAAPASSLDAGEVMVSTASLAESAPQTALSLAQVVAAAASLQLRYLQSRQGQADARGQVMTAKGFFDPTFQASASQNYNRTRTFTNDLSLPPNDTRQLDYSASLAQNLLTGGQISFTAGDTDQQQIPFPALHTASALFSASQPLLRNAGPAAALAAIRQAFAALQAADATARRALEQAVADAENAYWQLQQAEAQADAARLSMDAGDSLLARNRQLERRQLIAPFDVLTAAAGAAERRTTYLRAEQARRDAVDQLIFTAFGEDVARRFRAEGYDVRTTTEALPSGALAALPKAEEQALSQRPDLLAARASEEQAQAQADAAKRAALPELDATGSFGGVGSYQQNLDSARWNSLNRALDFADKQWSFGFKTNFPLLLRADRGRYRSALAALENRRLQVIAAENVVRQDVRAADRAVRFGFTRLAEADQAVDLSQRQLAGEQKRLQLGLSDSFRLLQVEYQTTQARVNQATARADLFRAETAYRLALGDIENDYGAAKAGP